MLSREHKIRGDASKAWVAQQKFKIAIDGPAGAGKSTVAQLVASALGYLYIDTGAMYRAATLAVLRAKIPFDHHNAIAELIGHTSIELQPAQAQSHEKAHVFLNNEDVSLEIRNRQVTAAVSAVSAVMRVRDLLVEKQRKMAIPGAVILDGRDIGTVVMPDADLKIFLTASAEVRARRRLEELVALGQELEYETILKEIVERDRKDSNRAIAPLQQAQDAIMILSDNLAIDQVVDTIIKLCDRRPVEAPP